MKKNHFYKTGVDITKAKEMFDFINEHFTYYTLNSWNQLRSIANNVKLYNLNLEGDWGTAMDYIFSENDNCIDVPPAFKQAKNVIYGGSAFTNKKYVPFENELIDFTIPKPNIYSGLLKERYQIGVKEKNINHILEDS